MFLFVVDCVEGTGDKNAEHAQNQNIGQKEETWKPTQEWLDALLMKKKGDLEPILRLIEGLYPRVEKYCAGENGEDGADTYEVLDFLQNTTLVGILPQPHAITIRTYQPNAYTSLWFSTYLWGVIFTRSQQLPYYDWRKVQLIMIVR